MPVRRSGYRSAETFPGRAAQVPLGDSERQYEDAVGVIRVQGSRLDWAYLEHWADGLGLRDLLERSREGESFRA